MMSQQILFIALLITLPASFATSNATTKHKQDAPTHSKKTTSSDNVATDTPKFNASAFSIDEIEKAIRVNVDANKLKKYATNHKNKEQDFHVDPKFDLGDNIKRSENKKQVSGKVKPSLNDLEKEIRVKVFNKKASRMSTRDSRPHNFNVAPVDEIGKGIRKTFRDNATHGALSPELIDPKVAGNHTGHGSKSIDLNDYVQWLVQEKSRLDRFRQLKSEIDLMNRLTYKQSEHAHDKSSRSKNLDSLSQKLESIIEQLEKLEKSRRNEEL